MTGLDVIAIALAVGSATWALTCLGARNDARWYAERLRRKLRTLRSANEEFERAVNEMRVERDAAWAKLARRSAGVARGNRTRKLRRNGGLLPAPINDPASAAPRNTLTG